MQNYSSSFVGIPERESTSEFEIVTNLFSFQIAGYFSDDRYMDFKTTNILEAVICIKWRE